MSVLDHPLCPARKLSSKAIIDPLLTTLVRSRWLDISPILFYLLVYGPGPCLGLLIIIKKTPRPISSLVYLTLGNNINPYVRHSTSLQVDLLYDSDGVNTEHQQRVSPRDFNFRITEKFQGSLIWKIAIIEYFENKLFNKECSTDRRVEFAFE